MLAYLILQIDKYLLAQKFEQTNMHVFVVINIYVFVINVYFKTINIVFHHIIMYPHSFLTNISTTHLFVYYLFLQVRCKQLSQYTKVILVKLINNN